MNRRTGSKNTLFSLFSKKKGQKISSEGVFVKDIFEKPILWALLGFGIASIVFLFLDITKSESERGVPISSPSLELQEISNQLFHVTRSLENLHAEMVARSAKDDQYLQAMNRMEKLVKDEIGKLSTPPVEQVKTSPVTLQRIPVQPSSNITAKGLDGVQATSAIELRIQPQPKGDAAVQTKKVNTQKKLDPVSPPSKEEAPVQTVQVNAQKKPDSTSPSPAAAAFASKPHTVQPGDTLFSIARVNKIPLARLLEANDLQEGAIIRVGQTLVIPK